MQLNVKGVLEHPTKARCKYCLARVTVDPEDWNRESDWLLKGDPWTTYLEWRCPTCNTLNGVETTAAFAEEWR